MIDPKTGIKPIAEWGKECARGFVRDARFGPGQVIKGTNRNKPRQNIKAQEKIANATARANQAPLY